MRLSTRNLPFVAQARSGPWPVGAVLMILWVASVVLLNDMNRALEFDEAVYLSEASSSPDLVGFGPHRARGIVWLIEPVVSCGGSILAIRWYLLAITLLGLVLIAVTWWPLVRWWAIWGTSIFAWHWLVLFYAIEISPNLFAAIAVVISVGLSVRNLLAPSKQTMVLAGLTFFVAVLIRPTDSACIFAGLAAATLLFGHSGRKTAITLGTAFAIGIIPWVVESYLRWEGVINRLKEASPIIDIAGKTPAGVQHLHLLDGPLMGPDPSKSVSWVAVAFCTTLLLLFVLQLVGKDAARTRRLMIAAAAGGLVLLVFYLGGAGVSAPRFLLPCYVIGIMASSLGARRQTKYTTSALAIGFFALSLSSPWSMGVTRSINEEQTPHRLDSVVVGRALAELAGSQSCSFKAQFGHPQISIASGCKGATVNPFSTDIPDPTTASETSFFVLVSTPSPESPLNTWESTTVVGASGTTFTIYIDPNNH